MNEEKRNENKKNILIIFLVSFFFSIIFILWLFNFLNTLKTTNFNITVPDSQSVLEIKDGFKNLLDLADKPFDTKEVNIFNEDDLTDTDSVNKTEIKKQESLDENASPDVSIPDEKKDEIDNKLTKKCPAYVNCMPMIDSEPNCSIPMGCEDVTQLLY